MNSFYENLRNGDVSFFDTVVGAFEWNEHQHVPINCQFAIRSETQNKESPDAPHPDVIHAFAGDNLAAYAGHFPPPDTWKACWEENDLGAQTIVLAVHNANMGAGAVKIGLDTIERDHPVLINPGYLGGCTVLYCYNSNSNDFYCLHTGGESGSAFSTQGVGINHLCTVFNRLKDTDDPVIDPADPCTADDKCLNPTLLKFGPNVGRSVAIFTCKLQDCAMASSDTVEVFNYYQDENVRYARAYALLYRDENNNPGIKVFACRDADPLGESSGMAVNSLAYVLL